MPSNIMDHHHHHHSSYHHSSIPAAAAALPQRCFQCGAIGGPLLIAATDGDEDIDDTNQRSSSKPR